MSKYNTLGDWCLETGTNRSALSAIVMGRSNLAHKDVLMYCEKLDIKQGEIGHYFYPEVKE